MKLNFGPKGMIQLDDARITFTHFSGERNKFHKVGERDFCVVIDDTEIADALVDEGWNVKIKPPREEGDMPFMYLKVKVRFNNFGPRVYLETGNNVTLLNEDTIESLDKIDILSVDMDIRPYDYEKDDGGTGRAAYLNSMSVVQKLDRIAERYNNREVF